MRIYSIAKTIADAFRNPKLVDRSVAIEGMKAALGARRATLEPRVISGWKSTPLTVRKGEKQTLGKSFCCRENGHSAEGTRLPSNLFWRRFSKTSVRMYVFERGPFAAPHRDRWESTSAYFTGISEFAVFKRLPSCVDCFSGSLLSRSQSQSAWTGGRVKLRVQQDM